MERMLTRLSERFPDVSFITEMFKEMRSQGVEVDAESKYYPNSLLLAVLFRLQARLEAPFKKAGVELEDKTALVELIGYFWHQLDTVAVLLREGLKGETKEEVREAVETSRVKIAERLGFDQEEVPLASVSELRGVDDQLRIDDHCPDFVVVVDREHKVRLNKKIVVLHFPTGSGPLHSRFARLPRPPRTVGLCDGLHLEDDALPRRGGTQWDLERRDQSEEGRYAVPSSAT